MLISNSYRPTFTFQSRPPKPQPEQRGYAMRRGENGWVTPEELYDTQKTKGYYYTDYIPRGDKSYDELDFWRQSYKKFPTLENKQRLLDVERKMLYEELEHPELTLARNYEELSPFLDGMNPEEMDEIITYYNTFGLIRLEQLHSLGFPTKYSDEKIEILKNVFKNANEDTEFGRLTRLNTMCIMSLLLDIEPDKKDKKSEIQDFVDKNSKYRYVVYEEKVTKDTTKEIEKLKENIEQPELFRYVLDVSDKKNHEDVTNLVEDILTDENSSLGTKRLAVWGAGKFRSDKNFEIIKDIALDKNETDIRMRELAIQSSALYLRERHDEVVNMMDEISNDGTIFSPLGKILKDKVTGNYHSQNERELNYQGFSLEQRNVLYDFANKKITGDGTINKQQQNSLLKDLCYFHQAIKNNGDDYTDTFVLKDTATRVTPANAGHRMFSPLYPKYSGHFYDTVTGINSEDYIMFSTHLLKANSFQSSLAHEFSHELNYYFDDEDMKIQRELYENAKKENKLITRYSGENMYDYFAVGMEAYVNPYVPHSLLITPGLDASRYALMEKDPDLYNFIEKVLQKY